MDVMKKDKEMGDGRKKEERRKMEDEGNGWDRRDL